MPSVWSHELFGHTPAAQLALTRARRPEGDHRFLGSRAPGRETQAQCLAAGGHYPFPDLVSPPQGESLGLGVQR